MRKFKIIDNYLTNPHDTLGMHIIEEKGKKKLNVRVYCETAVAVEIVPLEDEKKQYTLKATDEPYIFEGTMGRRSKPFTYKIKATDQEGNTWSYIDAYQFSPWITPEDELEYSKGEHYEIYKKLGAHLRKHEGVKGIGFAIWAPNAQAVSVVGDFNFWDGRKHRMRLLHTSGIWEIFIPEAEVNHHYKYEIINKEGVLVYKTDPYGMYYEKRPQTAAKIWNEQSYTWKDDRWLQKRKQKKHHKEAVSIYELHIGSWRKPEDKEFYTYREIADELVTYVKDMGYTHVEVMGVMEHPFDGSWGYQVTGYFAPTSRYGTPDDFKYFVDTMHKHQIGVILDWVPAHFPKDGFALEKFDGTSLYEHESKELAEHPEWGTLIFNYGRYEVKNFLVASALSWLERYHIDGLRVDAVASMLYLNYGKSGDNYPRNQYGGCENLEAVDFIQTLNKEAYTRFNGVMMIAEESTSWKGVTHSTAEGGLGFGFKWNMGWMNDFLDYMSTDPIYRKYEHNKITFSLMYAFNENFILPLSHDEVVHGKSPMIYKMPGDSWQKFANLRLAYGYLFMHPGKKMLFMGNEFAQTTEWSEKTELNWDLLQHEPHEKMQQFIKKLNNFYKQQKSLWEVDDSYDGFEWIDCDNRDESMVSFIRKAKDPKNNLVVIVNFTPEVRRNYRLGLPYEGLYEEVLNSDSVEYYGSGIINEPQKSQNIEVGKFKSSIEINVPPLAIAVFKCQNTKEVTEIQKSQKVQKKQKVEKLSEKLSSTETTTDKNKSKDKAKNKPKNKPKK